MAQQISDGEIEAAYRENGVPVPDISKHVTSMQFKSVFNLFLKKQSAELKEEFDRAGRVFVDSAGTVTDRQKKTIAETAAATVEEVLTPRMAELDAIGLRLVDKATEALRSAPGAYHSMNVKTECILALQVGLLMVWGVFFWKTMTFINETPDLPALQERASALRKDIAELKRQYAEVERCGIRFQTYEGRPCLVTPPNVEIRQFGTGVEDRRIWYEVLRH